MVASGLLAMFAGGLPSAEKVSGLGTALTVGEPVLEVIGHYAPSVRVPEGGIAVGAGVDADLRLTESAVAESLGRLTPDGAGSFTYVHDTTTNDAAFYTGPAGRLGGLVARPDALAPVEDGMRVVVAPAGLTDEDRSRACDPSTQGPWTATSLHLVDGTGLWVRDEHGRALTLELPAVPGASRPVGGGSLTWDGDHLLLTSSLGNAWIAGPIERALAAPPSPPPVPLDTPFARAIGLGRVFPGSDDPRLALGGGRFVKPDAYVQLGDAAPVPVGVTGASPPVSEAFHVFRRRPRAESAVPWVLALSEAVGGDSPSDRPRVGRAPGYDGRVYRCVEGHAEPIGEADLRVGDVMLAGHTTWEVRLGQGHRVDLMNAEPPSHRVHALASLSTGWLRTSNLPIEVPRCPATPEDPRRSLVLRGTTGASAVPPDVEPETTAPIPAPGQQIARLPLPRWAAAGHTDVQEHGALEVDLVELCVEQGTLVVLGDKSPPGQPMLELSGGRIGPGGRFGVAGHVLRYTSGRPLLEQVLPIGAFLVLVHGLAGLAAFRLSRHASPHGTPAERHGPSLIVALFCGAISIGALLQLRLAASPYLLGSADYLQRHLITSYLAAAGLLVAVDFGLTWREESGVARLARVLGVGRVASTGLLVWLLFDRAVFAAFGPPDGPAGPSVYGDLDGFALFAAVACATSWTAPLLLAVAPVASAVGGMFARARALAPPALPDVPAEPGASRASRARALVAGALGAPGRAIVPLLIGGLVLAGGTAIGGSGRTLGGFDLKLAEFAALPVGLGLSGLLVGWSRVGSSFGRLAVIFGTLGWLGGLTAVVVVFYALRGDLGPLMVLVPAIGLTIGAWALPWRAGPTGAQDLRERVIVVVGYAACMALAFGAVYAAVPAIEAHLTEIPGIGAHVERAVQRFETYGATWYTEEGHWSTTANWIAAGFYENHEHYVSNLHSDLAFVAAMQAFHALRALVLLAVFGAIVLVLLALGESALARAEATWGRALSTLSDADRDARRRYFREQVPVFLEAGETGYFLVFTSAYVLMEVLIHVGTCFNTLPQTGITLPWISSGGSASVGFAILLGAALARSVRTGARLDRAAAR